MSVAPFPEELDALRRDRGLSYRALARQTGISASYLCNLVTGQRGARASDLLIERLAGALGVPPDEFQEYRVRRVIERSPEAVDELYRRLVS